MNSETTSHELDPFVLRNGFHPHASFVRLKPRRRRRRVYLTIIDWGGGLAVAMLVGAMFLVAAAACFGAFWLLLVAVDAVVRRLGG